MTPSGTTMLFIIFLKFGSNRDQAGLWMAEHRQWIQLGVVDGSFLMAGSLDKAKGGVVIAVGQNSEDIRARVAQDPFVIHGVVCAEVHAVAPSLMVDGMAALLHSAHAGQGA